MKAIINANAVQHKQIKETMESFSWSASSAFKKATSGISVTVSTPTPVVSIGKSFDVTEPNDPKRDAYRNCSNCKKHYNYHSGSGHACPKSSKK